MSRLGVRQPLRWAVVLLAVGALGLTGALVGIGDGGTTGQTGRLHGMITRGPITPVCRKGTPCSVPASGARLVFKLNGRAARSLVVAKDGSYSVWLAAGVYTVAVSPQTTIGRGIEPRTVRVAAGLARMVDFQIDTGIR